jgi:mono/diheme cytochrome c family protein
MGLSGGLIPMQNWYAPSLASPTSRVADCVDAIAQLLATGPAAARCWGPWPKWCCTAHSTEPADVRAMAVHLRSPYRHDPREVQRADPSVLQRGGKLYKDHCASCHGDKGQGVADAYPPLAGNRAVTQGVTSNLVQIVLHGGFPPATRGQPRPFGMPPFATTLSDADVAAVITYIRSSWKNRAAPVSEFSVAQQRSSTRE